MESKNVFDAIMDYIDDSVKLSYEEISRGIYEISGYTVWISENFFRFCQQEKLVCTIIF